MTRAGGLRGLSPFDVGTGTPGKHRLTAAGSGPGANLDVDEESRSEGLFTTFACELAATRPGADVAILQAGCTTTAGELDLTALRSSGHEVEVHLIDDQTPQTKAAVAARPELRSALLGELRLVPIRPRSFDIVQCSLLLHRIRNAELVLDRLLAALRPGGLLLLRMTDPASAAGFLDRRLPYPIRALSWRSTWPGRPGPHAAVYEPVAWPRGIELFMSRHGLSVAHRSTGWAAEAAALPTTLQTPVRLVTWLSRGRLRCDHDELRYVVRKPEDRFARVLH